MDSKNARAYEIWAAWLLVGGILLVFAGEPWAFAAIPLALVISSTIR